MKCFVIMPFGNPQVDPEQTKKLDLIYSQWIKPTVEEIVFPHSDQKVECIRGDKEIRTGEIISHIVEHLVSAEIVIADLTGKNANVFYELGVRHSVRGNTILISEDLDDIPFDLRGLRTISYRYDPEGMLNFRNAIKVAILEIIKKPQKIDNPVRRYLYGVEVEKILQSSAPPGYDVLKEILSEMADLKREFRDQITDVRRIVELITSTQSIDQKEDVEDLSQLEGVWENYMSGSVFCARMIDGKLLIPYRYGGEKDLTAHYYNCRFVGNTLFGRFEWFNDPISGIGQFRLESEDRLVGGWWSSRDLPKDMESNILELDDRIPGMIRSTWTRDRSIKQCPDWADKYFKNLERYGS